MCTEAVHVESTKKIIKLHKMDRGEKHTLHQVIHRIPKNAKNIS